ncbi:hypothetical protein ABGB17_34115 [Sphaerisporangium sp. B11E5]
MFAAAFILFTMIITVPLYEMTVNNRPRRRRTPSGRGHAHTGLRAPAEVR